MKKIIIAIVVAFVLNHFSAFSKDDGAYMAKLGDQALLFKLNGLSNLGPDNFKGGIGYQYYFQNHTAFRLGLGIGFSAENQSKPVSGIKDYNKTDLSFCFSPGIRYNFGTSSTVLAYMGTEAIISLNKSKEEGSNFFDITKETKSNEYGAGFFIGAEWFAFKNVSISAEYTLQLKYSSGSEETTSPSESIKKDIPNKFSAGLGNSSLYFTLSFFFN